MVRAKGFIRFADGAQLFNFVAGRWELEPFESDRTELVFIGRNIAAERSAILGELKECIRQNDEAQAVDVMSDVKWRSTPLPLVNPDHYDSAM